MRAQAFVYLDFLNTSTRVQPLGLWSDSSAPTVVEGALAAAVASWNAVPCAVPKFRIEGIALDAGSDVGNTFDSLNVVPVWVGASSQVAYSHLSPSISALALPRAVSQVLQTCDVLLNGVDFTWSAQAVVAPGALDLESVLLHELGHCLGLGHNTLSSLDVMVGAVTLGQAKRALRPNDIEALCRRYPTPDYDAGQSAGGSAQDSGASACLMEVDCPVGLTCRAGKCLTPAVDAGCVTCETARPFPSGCGCQTGAPAFLWAAWSAAWANRKRRK